MRFYLVLLLLVAIAITPLVSADVRYSINEVPIPAGAAGGWALSVNDHNQIVAGALAPETKTFFGLLYDAHELTMLDPRAFKISNAGHVVGGTELWHAGTATQLAELPGGVPRHVSAFSVNDRGEVVGQSFIEQNRLPVGRAVLWSGDRVIDLGAPAHLPSLASDINNSTQIVGTSGNQAFFWEAGVMQALPAPGAVWSCAEAINNLGQVVGTYGLANAADPSLAALWAEGRLIPLGSLDGMSMAPRAINDAGQIVGAAWVPLEQSRAVIWEDAKAIDLNTLIPPDSGWTLTFAADINASGAIVGQGFHNGRQRGFLLTPLAGSTGVPEPGGMGLVLMTAALARRRRAA